MPVGAKYKPKDKNELLDLLKDGVECINIDFSLLVNLKELFYNEEDILLQDNVYFVDSNNPDLLIWNTSNVIDMSGMFKRCKKFNKPVKLDTSNVIDMSKIFFDCKNFNQPVDFDTSNVIDMSNMFDGCEEFNQFINFNTFKVISVNYMFNECENFNQPISFDVPNVNNMVGMFNYCKNLNSKIELKNIGKNVDEVLISFLFSGCKKLKLNNIDLDITDCRKIKGYDIYKDMWVNEFCEIFGKKNKNFNINDIINKLNDLMF